MKIKLPVTTIHEHTFVARHLRAASTVVDLGGNLGEFSRQMNARFGCTCFVVEPVPALFARLPRGPRLHCFNLAIARAKAPLEFYTSENITGGSLILREGVPDGQITVQGTTLDDFVRDNDIERIDLLKIDIEGAEVALRHPERPNAGQGASDHDRVSRFMPEVMSKRDVTRIRTRLARAGFRCVRWKLRSNFDVLFVRRELLSWPEFLFICYALRPLSKLVARLPLLRKLSIA